jgi:hypothetical protein
MNCTVGWMDPRIGLDVYGNSRPHGNSNPGLSIPQRTAKLITLSRPCKNYLNLFQCMTKQYLKQKTLLFETWWCLGAHPAYPRRTPMTAYLPFHLWNLIVIKMVLRHTKHVALSNKSFLELVTFATLLMCYNSSTFVETKGTSLPWTLPRWQRSSEVEKLSAFLLQGTQRWVARKTFWLSTLWA